MSSAGIAALAQLWFGCSLGARAAVEGAVLRIPFRSRRTFCPGRGSVADLPSFLLGSSVCAGRSSSWAVRPKHPGSPGPAARALPSTVRCSTRIEQSDSWNVFNSGFPGNSHEK